MACYYKSVLLFSFSQHLLACMEKEYGSKETDKISVLSSFAQCYNIVYACTYMKVYHLYQYTVWLMQDKMTAHPGTVNAKKWNQIRTSKTVDHNTVETEWLESEHHSIKNNKYLISGNILADYGKQWTTMWSKRNAVMTGQYALKSKRCSL